MIEHNKCNVLQLVHQVH